MSASPQPIAETSYDLARIRADFPSLAPDAEGKRLVFLDSAASTLKPRPVIERLSHFYLHEYANIHRGVYALSQAATEAYESARATVARFLGAREPAECIFVRGTTEGINLVAQTFGRARLARGDAVVLTGMEHHSNIVPWQILAEERGVELRVLPLDDDGDIDLADLDRALEDGKVKLVGAVYVSNALGTINPVPEIIERAHAKGAVVVVDAAQAAPHIALDVAALGVDFLAVSGHKLYGPSGIGILYGRRELLETLPPYQGGGDMITSVTWDGSHYDVPPARFEAGTPHIAGAVGLAAAIDYVQAIGIDAIAAHEGALLRHGEALLDAIPGLRRVGRARRRAGVLSFVMQGIPPADIGFLLDQQGIAIRTGHHCAQPVMDGFGLPATARASLGLYSSKEDLDALAEGLRAVVRIFGA